jgi:hypothetical protein
LAYIYFTEEQKQLAASVSLEEFLRRRGERLLRSGHDWRMGSDHSVTVRGNRWFDHSSGEGGGPVSFVRKRYGLSYPEAVSLLLDGAVCAAPEPEREYEKAFELPPKHTDMRRVFAYLMRKRFIEREVISQFAHEGLLYESAENLHNAVFVGLDEDGVPRHAHKRGLYSAGKAFKGNVYGSNPAYSFHRIGESERLFVFEAPIDLLSWLTLNSEDCQSQSYVALCGVSEHAMLKQLELHSHLQSVALCLDCDAAGIAASERLSRILRERGYEDVEVLRPQFKDWNEDLFAAQGEEMGLKSARDSAIMML